MSGKRPTGRRGLEGYDKSKDAAWEGRSARAFRDKDPAAYLPVIDSGGCWCGEPHGHDWPGKTDGAAHPREWRRVRDSGLTPGCGTYQLDLDDGHLTVIVGREPRDGGPLLWHMSISHRTNTRPAEPGRYPTWDEIKAARYRFMPLGITVAMLLPPPDEYVNLHETCFHLWECTCARE